MKKIVSLSPLFAFILLAVACDKKADFNYYYYSEADAKVISEHLNLPLEQPDDYLVRLPQHLTNTGLFPRPVEDDKATLGRVLFYDKKLSKDGTIACASCHKQELGFGDDVAFSRGVSDRSTDRNSFALSSVASFSAYYGTDLNGPSAIRFFWDNRAETVAEQSTGSLTNPKEMDMDLHDVADIVATQPYYAPLFKKAYGSTNVTQDLVLEAIANFVNAMGSFNSKFDQAANNGFASYLNNAYVYNQNFTTSGFTASENRGKTLYNTNCASCHSGNMGRPVLNYANNGLDLDTSGDQGVGAISGVSNQNGAFKVPTLRNVALSAPYMHDGRFKTLEEVVDHYASGIKSHPNLHAYLKTSNGQPKTMPFTQTDKQDLIAFLNTLTDDKLVANQVFSNPFKY
jgi:cytochrome c peroxidase